MFFRQLLLELQFLYIGYLVLAVALNSLLVYGTNTKKSGVLHYITFIVPAHAYLIRNIISVPCVYLRIAFKYVLPVQYFGVNVLTSLVSPSYLYSILPSTVDTVQYMVMVQLMAAVFCACTVPMSREGTVKYRSMYRYLRTRVLYHCMVRIRHSHRSVIVFHISYLFVLQHSTCTVPGILVVL